MRELERKTSLSVSLKSADKGLALVRFAQPDGRTIDKDGDATLPGAWPEGAVVAVSPFGHRSVTHGEIPAGRAVMRADGTADVKLFMETQAGRDTYVAMKELRDHVELSYGFRILELGDLTPELRQRGARRVLKKRDVLELSPVLRGAAASSGVLAIKASPPPSPSRAEIEALAADARRILASAKTLPLTPDQLHDRLTQAQWALCCTPEVKVDAERHRAATKAAEWAATK